MRLRRAAQLHAGKVHRHRKRHVHIIREQVQRHMRQDFDDGFVVEARGAHGLHVRLADLAAGFHQLQCKAQGGGRLGVRRLAGLGCRHLFRAGAGLAAQRRVGGQAIFAGIAVGHRHGNLFAQLRRDDAAAQGAERAPQLGRAHV
ncbi:hypothetical protein G6F24_017015 [Rhizopus arrhizus]|nr:hypothetical protein G6F24_017015 [Rhizopus arrhizus]